MSCTSFAPAVPNQVLRSPDPHSSRARSATLRHMGERMAVEKRSLQRDANNMRHAMGRFRAEMKRLEIYTEVRRT